MTYADGNPGPGLVQAQSCGRAKPLKVGFKQPPDNDIDQQSNKFIDPLPLKDHNLLQK